MAIPGQIRNGARYSEEALRRGASLIVAEEALTPQVPQLVVEDARRALPVLAHRVYGDPTAHLPVVGVTGTNGKTTVTHLVEQVLVSLGLRPAILGTIAYRAPGITRVAPHTTPEADVIARFAREVVALGASHLVMETSSHGLALHRSDAIHYDIAALTNLTRDHLDFHGSLEAYQQAKARLFRELQPSLSVIAVDQSFGRQLAGELRAGGRAVLTCSARGAGGAVDFGVLDHCETRAGLSARLQTPKGSTPAVQSTVGATQSRKPVRRTRHCLWAGPFCRRGARGACLCGGAPGRLERVTGDSGPLVLVDYAHTPDALANVLETLRPLTPGRLWLVFGCGGDRDKGKRAIMGQVAGRHATHVVVTNDNPRTEDPQAIAAAVAGGIDGEGQVAMPSVTLLAQGTGGFCVRLDRREAIQEVISALREDDTLLIAGKGHESVQIIGAERIPLDDREEALRAIRGRDGIEMAVGEGAR